MPAPRIWRSYHFRNAAVASVVAGLLLTAVSYSSYRGARQLDRARLDMELREVSLRVLVHSHPDWDFWEEVYDELQQQYAGEAGPGAILLVQDFWGNVVYQSDGWPDDLPLSEIPSPVEMPPLEGSEAGPPPPTPPATQRYLFWHGNGREWRIAVTNTHGLGLALGLDFYPAREPSRNYMTLLWVVVPLANVLIGVIVFVASYRAFRPVRLLAHTVGRITAQGLEERIPAGPWDLEFKELIDVVNAMLDRLSASFAVAGQFSADAAHELKTPLAVLQGELERGIQEAPAESPEQVRYGRLLDQVQRLKTITQKLLLLASVDAGNLKLYITAFDLSECIADACEDADILAPDITVTNNVPPGVVVMADADLLPQVVQNLVTNALLYNESGGHVTINYLESPDRLKLRFSNTGPGIPPEDMPRVFDRFYRGDKSRSRARGGSGLGLPLAREIARAHGGDVVLEASHAGVTSFVLYLPKTSLVRQTV